MEESNEITPTETESSPSVEDRLAAIEQSLADIKDTLDPGKSVEREHAMHAERHTKVPFEAPRVPPGLSPNQILEHQRVTGFAPVQEEEEVVSVPVTEDDE